MYTNILYYNRLLFHKMKNYKLYKLYISLRIDKFIYKHKDLSPRVKSSQCVY